ncbi:MAG: hypothetical protein FGM24_11445, partial [Candidatus Kapabacteria bacterium]|nr:hypothetical protein [Candidatus Kapabacteria bacterium]
MLRTCLLAVVIVALAGCSPEEPVINSFDDSWRMLVADSNSALTLLDMPSGDVVTTDLLSAGSDPALLCAGLSRFRDDVFVLHTGSSSITVLTADSLQRKARIETGAAGPASSMAFANATTAFATHPGSDVLSVIDLTTYTVADTLPLPGRPVAVAVVGNIGCVALQASSEIVFFDTRSFALSKPIQVATAPTYIQGDAVNDAFVIVSLGAGKVDAQAPTVPVISFASIASRSVVASVDLTPRAGQGADRVPLGLAITDEGSAYVVMRDVVLRVPLRSRSRATTVTEGTFAGIATIPTRAEIALSSTSDSGIEIYDVFMETKRLQVALPSAGRIMLPLT